MKKLVTGFLVVAALTAFQSLRAQTVDEVIDKYVTALGGKEKLASLKSVKKTGGLVVQGTDVGLVVPVLNGVGPRNDISVMGQEGYQITTATKGWNFMPFMGQASPEEEPAEQVQSSQNLLDLQGMLFNYKEKGSQVELQGKEKLDSGEAYKIKLTNKAGKVYTMFIDANTGYMVKTINKVYANGQADDLETGYSDFKKNEDGYVFPYAQTNPRGMITYTSIETNKPVDEKIFTSN